MIASSRAELSSTSFARAPPRVTTAFDSGVERGHDELPVRVEVRAAGAPGEGRVDPIAARRPGPARVRAVAGFGERQPVLARQG